MPLVKDENVQPHDLSPLLSILLFINFINSLKGH